MGLNYKIMEEMSDNYRAQWIEKNDAAIRRLSLSDQKIVQALTSGEFSDIYEEYKYKQVPDIDKWAQKYVNVINLMVPEEFRDDFYHIIRKRNQFTYSYGYNRRSVRTSDYGPYLEDFFHLLLSYADFGFWGTDVEGFIRDRMPEDKVLYKYDNSFGWWRKKVNTVDVEDIIMARIDAGDLGVIGAIRDAFMSENNTVAVTRSMIRAVVKSDDDEMHELLCKFLLAARLSEGIRQSICENADCGTAKAFVKILDTIIDNNLIRFAAVARAVATWTGVGGEKDPRRVIEKVLNDICLSIHDREMAESFLRSDDAVHINIGLWSIGFYDIEDVCAEIEKIASNGSRQQKFAASYYLHSLNRSVFKNRVARSVIEKAEGDQEVVMAYIPYYMPDYAYDDKVSISAYFTSADQARNHFEILKGLFEGLSKKKIVADPFVFPWFSAKLTKGMILGRMAYIAGGLDDSAMKEYVCDHLDDINDDEERRNRALKICVENPTAEFQRRKLISCLANRGSSTRGTACMLIEKVDLRDDEYIEIEKLLRYKLGDIRTGVIDILKRQNPDGLHDSVLRLVSSGDKMMRLGGMDIFRENQEKIADKESILEAVRSIEDADNEEKIIIDDIVGTSDDHVSKGDPLELPGFGLYDPEKVFLPINEKYPYGFFKKEPFKNYFNTTEKRMYELLDRLTALIDENAELEYRDSSGEEHRLGDMSDGEYFHTTSWNDGKSVSDHYPFKDLWKRYYEENKIDEREVILLEFYLRGSGYISEDEVTQDDYKKYRKNFEYIFRENELKIRYKPFKYGIWNFDIFILILKDLNGKNDTRIPVDVMKSILQYFVLKVPESELWLQPRKPGSYDHFDKIDIMDDCRIRSLLSDARSDYLDDSFKEIAPWLMAFEYRMHYKDHLTKYGRDKEGGQLDIIYYLRAYCERLIPKQYVYRVILEWTADEDALKVLSEFADGSLSMYTKSCIRRHTGISDDKEITDDLPIVKAGREIYQELTDMILKVELRRGDSPTIFSSRITQIGTVRGISRLMEILNALGDSTLDRNRWSWGVGDSKKEVLSHLLRVSAPAPGETAEEFRRAVKENGIKEKRLFEVAMFAPEWIDLIEGYLGIKGFKSGCYYFMAHMNEWFDEKRMAIIARYTPLTSEELRDGCFDLSWFKDVYEELGEKNFDKIYKAAKYISDGGKHQRARKYADAAIGRVSAEEIETAIDDKRNKDLVMSLGLIPISDKKDMLQRYEFLQKFLKESRQFGAQRRASEAEAVNIALKNLATNAGYADDMRLTLAMETELANVNSRFFDGIEIGEYSVHIEVSSEGKSSLIIEKADKKPKTIPSALKKNEDFLEIKGFKDKLTKQYSRTVKMLERSMEDREVYELGELFVLDQNPVLRSIIGNLVLISTKSGELFLLEDKDSSDKNDTVRIAHPYDMYKAGMWTELQKRFFERYNDGNVKQPFRQVFRELYVKLDEELEKTDSRMFSGYQIQPKKAIACLQGRRWIVDYEDGLEKVDFKDNIIMEIYAAADWFSPADIEEPAIELVSFKDRKNWKSIKIKDVPDIVYSETMRDVDLAVSLAHPGGVDPETSHSTIEMRKVVLGFNLQLFGISNVTFDGTHALIAGKRGDYRIHLGSGVIHKVGGHQINIVAVHGSRKSKIFLPYVDEDPKTAEIMTKVLMFAADDKIKDPEILRQLF